MSGGRRTRPVPVIPSGPSVLEELYGAGEESETDTRETDSGRVSNTPPPVSGEPSDAQRTDDGKPGDPAAAAKDGSSRTPLGMTRHTLYISQTIAGQLDQAANRLQSELGGLVPKHRVLEAILSAGIEQAAEISVSLRTELIKNLTGGTRETGAGLRAAVKDTGRTTG